jgi:hypothetical protein
MIPTTVVLLLLGAALAVYLNDKNGESSSLWAQWERELTTIAGTLEDALGQIQCGYRRADRLKRGEMIAIAVAETRIEALPIPRSPAFPC